jgi:hypothetical protein
MIPEIAGETGGRGAMSEAMWSFYRELLAEQRALARKAPGFLLAYVVIATAIYVLLDVYAYEQGGLYGLAGMLVWGLGYVLFAGLMQNGGLTAGGVKTGIGTYFALGLAVSLFVGIGLVLLVLPGLYLLMRWLPAYSRALVSLDGVGNAMRWSWERTEPWQRPLSLGMLAPVLVIASSLVPDLVFATVEDIGWTGYTLLSIAWNGAVSIGLAWLSVFGVAAYKLVRDPVGEEGGGA